MPGSVPPSHLAWSAREIVGARIAADLGSFGGMRPGGLVAIMGGSVRLAKVPGGAVGTERCQAGPDRRRCAGVARSDCGCHSVVIANHVTCVRPGAGGPQIKLRPRRAGGPRNRS